MCSFTRSGDNRGYWKNLGSPWIRPRFFFPKIFNGLLFGWTLWMYLPNLKFVALPVPEIIGGSQKIWAAPWIRPCSLFFRRSHDVVVKFDTYRNVQRHRVVIIAIAWLSSKTITHKSRQNNRVEYIYILLFNSLFDSHCLRYKHHATVQKCWNCRLHSTTAMYW